MRNRLSTSGSTSSSSSFFFFARLVVLLGALHPSRPAPTIPVRVKVHTDIVKDLHVAETSTFGNVRKHLQTSLAEQLSSSRTSLIELNWKGYALLDSDRVIDVLYADCGVSAAKADVLPAEVPEIDAVWGFSYIVEPPTGCRGANDPLLVNLFPNATASSLVHSVSNLVVSNGLWTGCVTTHVDDILIEPVHGALGGQRRLMENPEAWLTDILPEDEDLVQLIAELQIS
jgi:hypothetical protein